MKLFIGPMSKNVVDAALEFVHDRPDSGLAGFIPSRRQIETADLGGGYVYGWSTEEFMEYLQKFRTGLIVKRDHAGPDQGAMKDNGLISLQADIRVGIRFLHIDPWKRYPRVEDAGRATSYYLDTCYNLDPECEFEVGTEEGIRKYDATELYEFLNIVRNTCQTPAFGCVRYAVVQSGTNVVGMRNVGHLDSQRSRAMTTVCHDMGLLAKEHNSDYLTKAEFQARVECGVDAFNIAPELGVLETSVMFDLLWRAKLTKEFDALVKRCVISGKWERWTDPTDFHMQEVIELARVCGHYNFDSEEGVMARFALSRFGDPNVDIRSAVRERLGEILG